MDYLLATLALGYVIVASFGMRGMSNVLVWSSFDMMFFLFRRSWVLSVGDGGDGSWACWHAAAHVSAAIAGFFGALGGIDGWRHDTSLLSSRDNLPATFSVALILAVVAFDLSWRA